MDLFYSYKDYRLLFKKFIVYQKFMGNFKCSIEALAMAIEVKRPYLSKVLNLKAHLSSDQLYLANIFFEFSAKQEVYVKLLHEFQRSKVKIRRKKLKEQLKDIFEEEIKVDKQIKTKMINKNFESNYFNYFLNPHIQLVHIFLTIKKYVNNISLISDVLKITPLQLLEYLGELEMLGLVIKKSNGKYEVIKNSIFLPESSKIYNPYKIISKQLASTQLKKTPVKELNSLALVFSCSENTWNSFRVSIIQLIKELEIQVKRDKNPEVVLQLNFDLFPRK